MDAQFQNNLARGLGAVADTFGRYAMAAHNERLQTAKENFASMLEDKKQAAEDARSSASEAQRAQDRADAATLSRQQHQDDKEQQDNQFNQSQAQRAAEFSASQGRMIDSEGANLSVAKGRLAVEQAREAREAATTGDNKPEKQTDLMSRVKFTDKALADAQDAFKAAKSGASPEEAVAAGTAYGRALVDARAARAAAGLQPPVEVRLTPPTTAPAATAPATTAPAAPKVKYDAQGKPWTLGPDGKPVPYNPAADASASGDATQQPAASAGSYADAQPAAAPAPPDTTTPLGVPDQSIPPLAS
jgi:hypothetical protein